MNVFGSVSKAMTQDEKVIRNLKKARFYVCHAMGYLDMKNDRSQSQQLVNLYRTLDEAIRRRSK